MLWKEVCKYEVLNIKLQQLGKIQIRTAKVVYDSIVKYVSNWLRQIR